MLASGNRRNLHISFVLSIAVAVLYILYGPHDGIVSERDSFSDNEEEEIGHGSMSSHGCLDRRGKPNILTDRTILIAAGPRRAASTWEYSALINIAREFNVTHKAMCLYDSSEFPLGNFPNRTLIQGKKSIILKSHIYDLRLELMATHIFSSYRDIRDEYYSIIQKNMRHCANSTEGYYRKCREILHDSFLNQQLWSEKADYLFRYETFIQNPKQILREIGLTLGLDIKPEQLSRILASVEKDLNVHRSEFLRDHSHPYFFVTNNHRSKGGNPFGYLSRLSPGEVDCLNYHYHKWLTGHGYNVDSVPEKEPPGCDLPSSVGVE